MLDIESVDILDTVSLDPKGKVVGAAIDESCVFHKYESVELLVDLVDLSPSLFVILNFGLVDSAFGGWVIDIVGGGIMLSS